MIQAYKCLFTPVRNINSSLSILLFRFRYGCLKLLIFTSSKNNHCRQRLKHHLWISLLVKFLNEILPRIEATVDQFHVTEFSHYLWNGFRPNSEKNITCNLLSKVKILGKGLHDWRSGGILRPVPKMRPLICNVFNFPYICVSLWFGVEYAARKVAGGEKKLANVWKI